MEYRNTHLLWVTLFIHIDTPLETLVLQMNDLKSKNMVHCRRAGIGNEKCAVSFQSWEKLMSLPQIPMCLGFTCLISSIRTSDMREVLEMHSAGKHGQKKKKHIKYMTFLHLKALTGYFLQSNFHFRELCLLWLNHLHLDNINTPNQSTAGVAFGTECHS